jgi:hypothetical protein
MLAHTLARAAISWSSHHVIEIVPPFIEFHLINDKS